MSGRRLLVRLSPIRRGADSTGSVPTSVLTPGEGRYSVSFATMASTKPIVLYVEDEEADRFLVQRAFEKEGLGPALRMVNHGQAAIDYLSGAGLYAERQSYPLPWVVLLDLNLPEVHGFEVLKWIRAHPSHHELPVVVFTSSAREEDCDRSRLLGANEFMQKPGLPSLFQEVVRRLNKQWLGQSVQG